MNLQQVDLSITGMYVPGNIPQVVAFTSIFYVIIFIFGKSLSNVSLRGKL